jgi:hypothetical protein
MAFLTFCREEKLISVPVAPHDFLDEGVPLYQDVLREWFRMMILQDLLSLLSGGNRTLMGGPLD